MARGSKPGERRGGRKKGTPNKSTIAQGIALSTLAQQYTETALETLVAIARSGESEAARVSAAVAILDRGHGKPPQAVEHSGKDGGAILFQTVYEREPDN